MNVCFTCGADIGPCALANCGSARHYCSEKCRPLRWADVPAGSRLGGLAPIGIPWAGVKLRDGRVRPDKGCPASEFAVTHALVDGVSRPVTFE